MQKSKGTFLVATFFCLGWLAILTAVIFLKGHHLSATASHLNSRNLIRLHVIANSDSPEDQDLKFKVRDIILKETAPSLGHMKDKEMVKSWLAENLAYLAWASKAELARLGHPQSVRVQLGEFDFPTRSYDRLVLPQGRYEALRVIIGEGQGSNWWCVLFPPLCVVDVAEGQASREAMAGSSHRDGDYELRFKIVELLRASTQRLASLRW